MVWLPNFYFLFSFNSLTLLWIFSILQVLYTIHLVFEFPFVLNLFKIPMTSSQKFSSTSFPSCISLQNDQPFDVKSVFDDNMDSTHNSTVLILATIKPQKQKIKLQTECSVGVSSMVMYFIVIEPIYLEVNFGDDHRFFWHFTAMGYCRFGDDAKCNQTGPLNQDRMWKWQMGINWQELIESSDQTVGL